MRVANNFSGRIGSATRPSCHRNVAIRTKPTTNDATVTGEDQPSCPACTSPSTIPVMPMVHVDAPKRSWWPWRRSVSLSTIRPTSQTEMPMGTFTNMTQRQETSWVSSPPAIRPIAPPAADTVV